MRSRMEGKHMADVRSESAMPEENGCFFQDCQGRIRELFLPVGMFLISLMLAWATGFSAQAQESVPETVVMQMPGFVMEQWNAPRQLLVSTKAYVRELPDKQLSGFGTITKGQYVNAWGQTDTGWYLIEYNGRLGYVRYEAGSFVRQEPAGAQTLQEQMLLEQQALAAAQALQEQQALAAAQALQEQQALAAAQALQEQQALAAAQALQEQQALAAAQALQEQQALAAAQALQEQQALAAAQQQAAIQALAQQPAVAAGVVFIGDSRMVTLKEAVERNIGICPATVIAKNGSRHEWFHDTAIPQADKIIGKGSKVVINMGVNDLSYADQYARDVNYWAAVWSARGAQVYYASVNPVWANSHNMTKERVEAFNARLSTQLIPQIIWLDSYTYLMQSGVHSNDGIHYKDDTNLILFQYYMMMIGAI